MSINELKQAGVNLNSYLSVGLMLVIISATLWINNSINDVKTNQLRQELSQISANAAMKSTIDEMKVRIDGLVTRPELEAAISSMRLEQSRIELQLLRTQQYPSKSIAK